MIFEDVRVAIIIIIIHYPRVWTSLELQLLSEIACYFKYTQFTRIDCEVAPCE